MLAIRLQRTGRTGHAQFRVIVQDSRFSPKRGRVVAYGGSYDPHTKIASLHTDVISSYLEKGAQPSDRVARLLKKEGVKLPKWVSLAEPKKRAVRNPDKLRRNRPPEAKAPKPVVSAEPEAAESAETPNEGAEVKPVDTQVPELASEKVPSDTSVEKTQTKPEVDQKSHNLPEAGVRAEPTPKPESEKPAQ